MFSTLEINPTLFRETNAELFNSSAYSDSALKALKKELAKTQLKQDLYDICGISNNSSKTTILDELVEDFNVESQLALMYKQLEIFYASLPQEQGDSNSVNTNRYKALYKDQLNYIKGLRTDNLNSGSFVVIERC